MSGEHQVAEFMLPDMDSTFRLFAAHLRTVTNEWSYPRHSHPLFEVNLLLAGSQEMIVNGQRYVQKPGDLLLLRPEDVHESRAAGTGRMTYYCLHFNVDDRVLREVLCRGEAVLYAADSPLAQKIRPSLDRLIALTSSGAGVKLADKMRTLSALFELFAGLSDSLAESGGAGASGSRTHRVAAEIAAGLTRCVEAPDAWSRPAGAEAAGGGHAGHGEGGEAGSGDGDGGSGRDAGADGDEARETVAAVTAGLGYSASSCNRIFRSVYGMSPRQYLSALKLKKAKLLLMEPELSVEDVSQRLGYKDIAHFSRQFKRWTGEPPGKFRGRYHI
ncbi:AraC family transcriptional regulator [Paenibacillus oralis]|uniref:AraC family transcriptional regulator n=2 Tax=Paenibacillus oralis TaxID=2490856 RepID=A0A3P3UD83_9BACL|nr:AraC family transcriptional regulator [Paenibacillus oralis]